MSLTKVSYSMISGAPKSVLDYGADNTGNVDCLSAFQAAAVGGGHIYIPEGTYKLSGYVNLESNTHLTINGTIVIQQSSQVVDYYPGGFDAYIKENILVDGAGTITCQYLKDVADSVWLTSFGDQVKTVGFAAHVLFRACTNCTVRDINFHKSQGGVWINAADPVASPTWDFVPIPGHTYGSNNSIENVTANFVINASHAIRQQYYPKLINSHCYRSGDGGMYMQYCYHGLIDGNQRVSPYGDGTSYTPALLQNDSQGISIEASSYIIVSNNLVVGFLETGIDVKSNSTDVLVTGNIVKDCQIMSITARGGDVVYGTNTSITIVGNEIKNHGYLHDSNPTYVNYSIKGAIFVQNSYSCYIKDNTITGVNSTYGGNAILTQGVDITQLGFWSDYPIETRIGYTNLVIEGNTIDFPQYRVNYGDNPTNFQSNDYQLSGIKVTGLWGQVAVNHNSLMGNLFSAGKYSGVSVALAGIEVNGDGASAYGEAGIQSLNVSNNTIFGMNGGGIYVSGGNTGYSPNMNAVIDSNVITSLPGYGLYLDNLLFVSVTGNSIYNVGNVALDISRNAVQFESCSTATFSGNTVRRGATSYPYCVYCNNSSLFSNSNALQSGSTTPTGPAITVVGVGGVITANEGTDYMINNT